jgi:hypothetical protein
MDKIKLAQRTIALLSSMIESGECHTSRSREMKDNALNGLEQLRLGAVVGQSEQLVCPECKSTDCKTAIHTDYKECNKCYHYWEAN